MKQNGHPISLYWSEYKWAEYCSVCGAEGYALMYECSNKFIENADKKVDKDMEPK